MSSWDQKKNSGDVYPSTPKVQKEFCALEGKAPAPAPWVKDWLTGEELGPAPGDPVPKPLLRRPGLAQEPSRIRTKLTKCRSSPMGFYFEILHVIFTCPPKLQSTTLRYCFLRLIFSDSLHNRTLVVQHRLIYCVQAREYATVLF